MTRQRAMMLALVIILLAAAALKAADQPVTILPVDLVTPAQLNSELPAVKAGKIVLLQVGFHVMYQMGHIPGSQYAGPASKPVGLTALKNLLAKLPRTRQIVIYCGCCPWNDCPNIRPAFQALKQLGFVNFKVLNIPDRLGTDWTDQGYPVVKGD